MPNRRQVRLHSKVIHRHRVGMLVLRRVSELVFVHGEPKAILRWVDMAGDRAPVYLPLERERLRRSATLPRTYYYDGTTVDPRFAELEERAPARP